MNKISKSEELEIILSPKFINRFWSKVKKLSSGCWEWQNYKVKTGYGQVRVGDKIRGRIRYTHRIAYAIHYRKLPQKLLLHSCNNPKCCNPLHLKEGTQAENMEQMFTELRHVGQKEEIEMELRAILQRLTLAEKEILLKILLEG